MKEYKYRINGNLYTVKIGDIDNNLAKVEVNGVPYKVELQKTEKPVNIVTAPPPLCRTAHRKRSEGHQQT